MVRLLQQSDGRRTHNRERGGLSGVENGVLQKGTCSHTTIHLKMDGLAWGQIVWPVPQRAIVFYISIDGPDIPYICTMINAPRSNSRSCRSNRPTHRQSGPLVTCEECANCCVGWRVQPFRGVAGLQAKAKAPKLRYNLCVGTTPMLGCLSWFDQWGCLSWFDQWVQGEGREGSALEACVRR